MEDNEEKKFITCELTSEGTAISAHGSKNDHLIMLAAIVSAYRTEEFAHCPKGSKEFEAYQEIIDGILKEPEFTLGVMSIVGDLVENGLSIGNIAEKKTKKGVGKNGIN